RRLVQSNEQFLGIGFFTDSLDHSGERNGVAVRFHALSYSCVGQPKLASKVGPRFVLGFRCKAAELDLRTQQAAKVRKVKPQQAEERNPALGVTFELGVPIFGAGEPAMDHSHDACSTSAGFDRPFRCDRSRSFLGLGHEAARRVPKLDLRNRLHAWAEVADGVAVDLLFDLAWNEPRRNALSGRDLLPDPLRRSPNFDLGLDGPTALR